MILYLRKLKKQSRSQIKSKFEYFYIYSLHCIRNDPLESDK